MLSRRNLLKTPLFGFLTPILSADNLAEHADAPVKLSGGENTDAITIDKFNRCNIFDFHEVIGCYINDGSLNKPIIKLAFQKAYMSIFPNTSYRDNRTHKNVVVYMNPTTAMVVASSLETQQYIVQSPFAIAELRGEISGGFAIWGLPSHLYGINISVEDNVYTLACIEQRLDYVMRDNTMLFAACDYEKKSISFDTCFVYNNLYESKNLI
jgi:hypothetical protein